MAKKKNFMECESLDEFKEEFLKLYKQECALADGRSYWDVSTSNMDGTFFGEEFDNKIRIKALKDNNKEFFAEINEEELINEAKEIYSKDLERANKETNN